MIYIKSKDEIEIMKIGGSILRDTLKETLERATVGITLLELDQYAEKLIRKSGAVPSFPKVPGYKWTICSCINDVVVHGIPTDYSLREGDVVGIDCGVYYKGYHTDSAWTKFLPFKKPQSKKHADEELEKMKFLSTGEKALKKAIEKMRIGNYIYDISKAIQDTVETAGYSVVRTLVGHGVGRKLHEDPEVPGYVKEDRLDTLQIQDGMVLALEVIYNFGCPEVVYKGNDGWTIATKDGTMSGLFESTVAAMPHGCIVLT